MVFPVLRKFKSTTTGKFACRLGAGYAAMMNFATTPDISAAMYYIDSASANDPTLNVYKILLQHEFALEDRDWKPFVQASIGYLDYEAK